MKLFWLKDSCLNALESHDSSFENKSAAIIAHQLELQKLLQFKLKTFKP
jgi:hypothetical protein